MKLVQALFDPEGQTPTAVAVLFAFISIRLLEQVAVRSLDPHTTPQKIQVVFLRFSIARGLDLDFCFYAPQLSFPEALMRPFCVVTMHDFLAQTLGLSS